MKKSGVGGVAFALVLLMAIIGSVTVLVGKRPGSRFYVPVRNNIGQVTFGSLYSPARSGDPSLYLYLRKEDNFPEFFRALQYLRLYSPNTGIIIPTAHWQVLNMDKPDFLRAVQQTGMQQVEIEVLGPESCVVVDSRIDAKWLRPTPPPTVETELPYDVHQRYPRYFASAPPK